MIFIRQISKCVIFKLSSHTLYYAEACYKNLSRTIYARSAKATQLFL